MEPDYVTSPPLKQLIKTVKNIENIFIVFRLISNWLKLVHQDKKINNIIYVAEIYNWNCK